MANDFAQSFQSLASIGQNMVRQNLAMGVQASNFSLRQEQIELGRQQLQQRQAELQFGQMKQAADVKMEMYGKALALIKETGGETKEQLMNAVLGQLSQDFGIPFQQINIASAEETLARYKTAKTPEDFAVADALFLDSHNPEQLNAMLPTLQAAKAMSQMPKPEALPIGENQSLPHLYNIGFLQDRETGEYSNPDNPHPQPIQVSHDDFLKARELVQEHRNLEKTRLAMAALTPEAQTAMASALIKQIHNLPLTSKEEIEVFTFNRWNELQAKQNKTPEEIQEQADLERMPSLKIREEKKDIDALDQARIDNLNARSAKVKDERALVGALGQKIYAQTAEIEQQTRFAQEGHETELKMARALLAKTENQAEKEKHQATIARIHASNNEKLSDEFVQEAILKIQERQARVEQLTEQTRQLKLQGETLAEREQLELETLKVQLDVDKARVKYYEEQSDRAYQELLMAEKKLPAQIKVLEARANKLSQELTNIDAEKVKAQQALTRQRTVKARKEEAEFVGEQAVATHQQEFFDRGLDISNGNAVTDFMAEKGIQMPVAKFQELMGYKPASRLLLGKDEPTMASRTKAQTALDEGSFALTMLDELERTVASDTVGAMGKLRSLVHGVGQQASVFGQKLVQRAGRLAGEISSGEIQTTKGPKPNTVTATRFFDPQLTEFELLSELAAYEMAAAIANQEGRGLSDRDVANMKKALQFDVSLTGPEQVLTAIQTARNLIRSRMGIATKRLQGGQSKGAEPADLEEKTVDELFKMLQGQ